MYGYKTYTITYGILRNKERGRKDDKNAGGIIQSPFDSTIRSLLVGVYELGVKEIMIIGHTDCGAQHLDPDEMIRLMLERGVSQEHIDMMKYCGIDFRSWLNGFNNSEEAVRKSVEIVAKHPLMPKDIVVRGFIIDSYTGKLSEVIC